MRQIENYKGLKDSVQTWLNRNDSSTVNNIPMFINFAEKQFTRLVKLPYYESVSTLVVSEGFNYAVIPQDFLSAKNISVNGQPYNRAGVESFMRMKLSANPVSATPQQGSTTSKKNFFCRKGDQLHFLPELRKSDVVEMIYTQDIPEMSSDNDQPYSLLIAPDLLLYLTLRHAAIFLRDNEQEQYWMAKAQEAADTLNKQLDEVEWSGSSLVVPFFDE